MEYILSTVCTGIGSPEQGAAELSEETGLKHKIGFYCEINKYARASYEANFDAGFMVEDMTKEEWDGPEFYSDVIVGGIPCQSFSLAGLRKGELDPRGLLFYDYYRYVKKQKPKAFIIENVKGLLSDNSGKTFSNWLHLLGQSVNGHHQMFNSPDSLPYNLHWTVLNTKDFGVPQNRERVFLVGIRDDIPNTFRFPATEPLKLRLKDILEPVVDEKYYLSDKMLTYLNTRKDNFNGGKINYKYPEDVASCINASSKSIDISDNIIVANVDGKVVSDGFIKQDTQASQVYNPNGISPTICAGTHGVAMGYVKQDDPIIIVNNNGVMEERPNVPCIDANYHKGIDNHAQRGLVMVSKERRTAEAKAERRETGSNSFRGKELVFEPSDVMNCLQTGLTNDHLIVVGNLDNVPNEMRSRVYSATGISPTITSNTGGGHQPKIVEEVIQLNPSKESGGVQPYKQNRIFDADALSPALDTECGRPGYLVDDTPMLNEHRGHVDKEPRFITDGIVPTLRAESHGHETKVVVKEATKKGYDVAVEGDSINLSNPKSDTRRGRVGYQIANTLDTACNQATVINHRIRRLTPLECWRLQGFPDANFYKAQAAPMSDSQLYKQAGNSMTTNVIKGVLRNILKCIFETA